MNKATYFILFSIIFWATSSFAGENLFIACKNYGGTLFQSVTVKNYNYNTIASEFNIRTS